MATADAQTDSFATTHWSIVLAGTKADQPGFKQALDALVLCYRPAIVAFVRAYYRCDEPEAVDITQTFKVRRPIPTAFRSIVGRAMAADPATPCGSAGDIADDMRRWTDGLPVSAHRERWWERTARVAGRQRWGQAQPVSAANVG